MLKASAQPLMLRSLGAWVLSLSSFCLGLWYPTVLIFMMSGATVITIGSYTEIARGSALKTTSALVWGGLVLANFFGGNYLAELLQEGDLLLILAGRAFSFLLLGGGMVRAFDARD